MQVKRKIKSVLGRSLVASGRFKAKIAEQMTIIAFHRVNDDLPDKAITCDSQTFRRFCEFFRRYYEVVPLSEQVRACRAGQARGGTLSITFDDGYRDNHEVAAPILRELGLPATFFVTSGFIATEAVPFWDKTLPSAPGWMNWDQVRALASGDFEVGCHTHTHIDLAQSSTDQIRAELRQSRETLESQIGKRVGLFAYPFGGRDNINAISLQLVREAGFDCCVSSCGGVNTGQPDAFTLNRLPISGWFVDPHQMAAEIVLNKI